MKKFKSVATKISLALLAIVVAGGALFAGLALAVGIGAAIALVVTLLWNYAVAPALGLGAAKFLHVWGIMILVNIVIRLIRSAVTG